MRSISPCGASGRIAAVLQSRVTAGTPAAIVSARVSPRENTSATDRSGSIEQVPSSTYTLMSATIAGSGESTQPGSLWQLFHGNTLPDGIFTGVGYVLEAIQKVERLQDRGENTGADASVSPLDACDGHPGGCGSLCDDLHRQPASQPCRANVCAEFADGPAGCRGRIVRSGHYDIVLYH